MRSAKLFLQSSELGLPHPLSRRRVCPPSTLWSGGEGKLACGRGVGAVPIPTRGYPLWCCIYIYKYFVIWCHAFGALPVRGEWPVRTVGEVCVWRDAAARQQLQRHLAHRTVADQRTFFFSAGRFNRRVFLSRRFLKWPCLLSIHRKNDLYF